MQITFAADELRPMIEAVVTEVVSRFGDAGRVAFPEAEAAGLMGVKRHVLRDARLRGEISGSKVGRGYVYTRADLLAFLTRRKR
jgi:hypothetical protein